MMEGFDKRKDMTWSGQERLELLEREVQIQAASSIVQNPRYVCTLQYHIHKEEKYIYRPVRLYRGRPVFQQPSSAVKGHCAPISELGELQINYYYYYFVSKRNPFSPQINIYHSYLKPFTLASSQFGCHSGQRENFEQFGN